MSASLTNGLVLVLRLPLLLLIAIGAALVWAGSLADDQLNRRAAA